MHLAWVITFDSASPLHCTTSGRELTPVTVQIRSYNYQSAWIEGHAYHRCFHSPIGRSQRALQLSHRGGDRRLHTTHQVQGLFLLCIRLLPCCSRTSHYLSDPFGLAIIDFSSNRERCAHRSACAPGSSLMSYVKPALPAHYSAELSHGCHAQRPAYCPRPYAVQLL